MVGSRIVPEVADAIPAPTAGATAIMYTPNVPPWLQEAQLIRRALKPLGIDVQVKEFPIGNFFARIGRRGEPFDLAVSGWGFPSTDPAEVLGIFNGSTIRQNQNSNFSYFNDRAFNRRLKTAAKLSGARRYRAYSQPALELERDLVPAAAIATDASRDFFSARIGCQIYQPVYALDLAALCLRGVIAASGATTPGSVTRAVRPRPGYGERSPYGSPP